MSSPGDVRHDKVFPCPSGACTTIVMQSGNAYINIYHQCMFHERNDRIQIWSGYTPALHVHARARGVASGAGRREIERIACRLSSYYHT